MIYNNVHTRYKVTLLTTSSWHIKRQKSHFNFGKEGHIALEHFMKWNEKISILGFFSDLSR